jgi:TPR repeat protein
LPKDAAEAVKWYRRAAEQGYAEAQDRLGVCYYLGIGVPKDFAEAYKWFILASDKGDEDAKTNATVVGRQLTPERIVEAQRLAREFKPSAALEGDTPAPHD